MFGWWFRAELCCCRCVFALGCAAVRRWGTRDSDCWGAPVAAVSELFPGAAWAGLGSGRGVPGLRALLRAALGSQGVPGAGSSPEERRVPRE